jgi:hypothetical protein
MAIDIVLKDGSVTHDRRLDRLVHFDERSRAYRAVTGLEEHPLRSYSWRVNGWLDQGREGACCGFAWAHELIARPAEVPMTNEGARQVYFEAQKRDPWSGGAYPGASPFYEGTSVLAAAQAVMELRTARGKKFVESYRWTFSTEELIRVLGYRGGAVLGLRWYSGMFEADSDGFIVPAR